MCVFQCVHACFVSVYLIMSQCVESFPVIINLSCDVFILQNDSGHPTLTPFFKQMKQKLTTHSERQTFLHYYKSLAILILNDLSDDHCKYVLIVWSLQVIFIILLLVFVLHISKGNNFWLNKV